MIIRSKSPVRIGFAGGGTDTPPYCDEFGGVVVNATINKYVWATLKTRKDNKIILHSEDFGLKLEFNSVNEMKYDKQLDLFKAVVKNMNFHLKTGFELYLRSDVSLNSGLGGSASAFVAAISIFNHLLGEQRMTYYEIAELAHELERKELEIPGGRQDQYATQFGGFNFIEFKGGDFVRVSPLDLEKDTLLELEKNLVLIQVEKRKEGGYIISDQKKNLEKKKEKTWEGMHKTKKLAKETKYALLRGDLTKFGKLLDTAWEEKKKFSKLISNKHIDELYETAKKHGAIGGKITGAGGGGHMFFYCKPDTELSVANALEKKGAKIIQFSFDFEGTQVWDAKNGG